MGLYDYTVYQMVKRGAKVYRNRTALVFGEQEISYGEMQRNIDRLATGLVNHGINKGDRIGVLAKNCPGYIYLYGACAKLGAIVVPINWRLKADEIEYMISDSKPKMLFVGNGLHDIVSSLSSKFDFIQNFYALEDSAKSFRNFAELLMNKGNGIEPDVAADDPYLIMYTAAVTGKPRGAVISQRNMIASSMQCMYHWQLTRSDCNLGILPLFHMFGLLMLFNLMYAGGKTVLVSDFDAESCLKSIQEYRATIFAEFPPILSTLLENNMNLKYDLSSLRIVVGLDGPDTIRQLEETTEAIFWTLYGQTETSGIISYAPYFEKPGSAGIPGLICEVEIMDDSGGLVESGVSGEIVLRGPMVFKGYWNLEKTNRFTFRGDWHHTGDVGKLDASGFLWYEGRKSDKELIKPGGENVYPAEVEKVILEHPEVEEAVVIGVPDRQWGEAIKAICVLKEGSSLKETELSEFVASRIARYKRPKYVVFVSELPKDQGGSVNRAEVKLKYQTA